MAASKATAQRLPVEAPALDSQDASALRSFIETMIATGAVAMLVAWLIAFIKRLWKTQNDLLERTRAKRRRNGDNEALRRLQIMLPGFDWEAASNDNSTLPKKKRDPKSDKRRRGNNANRNEHGRGKWPDSLRREPVHLRVPDAQRACMCCGEPMTLKEWISREILEIIPAQHFVQVFLRERLECTKCQHECVAAEPPDTIKDKCTLGIDLTVEATVDHFLDGVPFERMERNARAQGVPLAANTLARSVYALIDLCDPIVKHIFQRCVASSVVGIDATSMPVLDRECAKGIRRAALWNFLGDNRWSYFGYATSGHGERLKELLNGCTLDVLQCDGSATLNTAERHAKARAGCHSHARSKLVDVLKSGDARALSAVLLYAELFAIEAESKALKESHDERLHRRMAQSRPLLNMLWAWADGLRPSVEPSSPLGRALTYLTNQRDTLELFLRDGRVAMTNNAVERELRTYVLDRKTWLFSGNELNAKRAAAALTIVRTCRLLGVDARAYLRTVVRRLLAGEKDAATLWPENFRAEQAGSIAA
jgi:transposase